MVTFCTFHVDVPPSTQDTIRAVNASFDALGARQMINLMFRSARRGFPHCRLVVLTDSSPLLVLGDRDALIVRDRQVDVSRPMLSRTRAYARFLARAGDDAEWGDLVLLDADILLAAPIDDIFDGAAFDVALTVREHEMPVNGGVLFVARYGARRAGAFLGEAVRRMMAGPPGESAWWGDQRAVWEIIAPVAVRAMEEAVEAGGARVRLFPCDPWNFSSKDNYAMPGPYPGRRILHFKGMRKRDMPTYWERFLRDQPLTTSV